MSHESTCSTLSGNNDKFKVKRVLDELCLKDSCTSDELLPLVKNVIPIYASLGAALQKTLRKVCANNFMLIPQIVEFIRELNQSTERKLYYKFVVDVLEKEEYCLKTIIDKSRKQQDTFIKSVFFGSRLFNSISEHISIVDYLNLLKGQWEFLLNNTNDFKRFHVESFIATLKLHETLGVEIIFGDLVFQDVKTWGSFISMLKVGSAIQQRKIFISYLVPYFCKLTRQESCSIIFALLQELPFELPIDSACYKWDNVWFKILYVRSLSESMRKTLLNDIFPFFENIDEYYDQEMAEVLLLLLRSLSPESKVALSKDPLCLSFVTKRLTSEIKNVRERTMFLAKEITNGEVEYSSDFHIAIPEVKIVKSNIVLPLPKIFSKPTNATESLGNSLATGIKQLSFDDSDDESENEHSYDILFVKDLLLEFERNQKADVSPLQLLKKTVNLIRQKQDFPSEVGFYSTALLTEISALSNNFDEDNFEQWVVNAIVSVLVVCPDKILDLYKILFNNELSLQQRLILLTSSALAARELKGYDDEMILSPKYDFVTRKLPSYSQETICNKTTEALPVVDMLKHDRVVWKSSKLSQIKNTYSKDNFKRHSSHFFYPLIHGWFNGIDMGTFDKIFKKHYILTLRTILDCSSASYKYEEMKTLMQQVELDAFNQKIPLD